MYLSQRCVWHCDGCLTGDETGVKAHIVGKEKHVALRCSVMVAIDMLVTLIDSKRGRACRVVTWIITPNSGAKAHRYFSIKIWSKYERSNGVLARHDQLHLSTWQLEKATHLQVISRFIPASL